MSLFKVKRKRLTFQKLGVSGLHCCVPGCTNSSLYNRNLSFHSFPRDNAVRLQWLTKIRRDFTPTKGTRVCSRHFLPGDIVQTPGGLRKLNKGNIPVLYAWNNYTLPRPSPADLAEDSQPDMVVVAPDHDYCVSVATGQMANELDNEPEALHSFTEELRSQVEQLQLWSRVFLQRFAGSDNDIRFYTRFESYRHFQYFWKLIEPAVKTKMLRVANTKASEPNSDSSHTSTKLLPIDELLLFLMYLSVGLHPRDLAERFGAHRSTVSRIITTWTHFLYHLLGSKPLWLPREVVRAHLPQEFAPFPDTHVILDCTEIFCQSPSDLLLQSELFSTYKSHSTFRAMIGMAPHGAIIFMSALYAGSMSDREIFKLSGITNLLKPDMAIMVDKGFLVDTLAPCKVYRQAFLSGKSQMSGNDVLQTQSVARLRVHVERCIRRVKENKLFDKVIPVSVCGSIDELFSVACYLVNYQNGPLVKAWAT